MSRPESGAVNPDPERHHGLVDGARQGRDGCQADGRRAQAARCRGQAASRLCRGLEPAARRCITCRTTTPTRWRISSRCWCANRAISARWPGSASIMQDLGDEKRALDAFRKALAIDPYLEKVPELVKTLTEKDRKAAISVEMSAHAPGAPPFEGTATGHSGVEPCEFSLELFVDQRQGLQCTADITIATQRRSHRWQFRSLNVIRFLRFFGLCKRSWADR